MPNGPTEIVPSAVFLGPAPVSQSGEPFDDSDDSHVAVLRRAGITHVVNCTPDVPFVTAAQLGQPVVGGFRVPVPDLDSAAAALAAHFVPAADFINDAVKAGGKVYVHCETGKSRSAAITLAYRIKCRGESLREAYNDTKTKRGYIQPKPAFFKELVAREPGWTTAALVTPSFPADEYTVIYLLDYFAPYAWIDGIFEAEVRATVAEVGGDSTAAHTKLAAIVREALH